MFGIFLDVTGRKQAEEAHELLAGEMGYQVKNLLANASSLTTIAKISTPKPERFIINPIHRMPRLNC